ncbi:hypothetical protein CALCODRAFT_504613 [Calocera cornea HHB12733]|uniref:Uncharacterized protein n=1 Tax=Calocera cornea HHB12733 TaxID=1353952 RepID=A0A165CBT8_9BASI|nr:hypothetical protein CALCODRAFT_504613 [Calocera cornea HHB12733]
MSVTRPSPPASGAGKGLSVATTLTDMSKYIKAEGTTSVNNVGRRSPRRMVWMSTSVATGDYGHMPVL